MPPTVSFRQLHVWQEAMLLVEEAYAVSRRFPDDERAGLTAELRRSAVAIASNIGEGARRNRRRAFLHHLDIALGRQGDVDVQLEIASRLGYCPASDYSRLMARVNRLGRMLNELIESLEPSDRDAMFTSH